MNRRACLSIGFALLVPMILLMLGVQAIKAAGNVTNCTNGRLDAALAGGGLVTFNCGGPATIVVSTTKTIALNTTIDGTNGGNALTLTALSGIRLFDVYSPATLTLTHLTVAGLNYFNAPIMVYSG